jgi:hypothetical protein
LYNEVAACLGGGIQSKEDELGFKVWRLDRPNKIALEVATNVNVAPINL